MICLITWCILFISVLELLIFFMWKEYWAENVWDPEIKLFAWSHPLISGNIYLVCLEYPILIPFESLCKWVTILGHFHLYTLNEHHLNTQRKRSGKTGSCEGKNHSQRLNDLVLSFLFRSERKSFSEEHMQRVQRNELTQVGSVALYTCKSCGKASINLCYNIIF